MLLCQEGKWSLCNFVLQIFFLENDTDVNDLNLYKKDFFHEVFHEMMSTCMFMFNDSKTLAWFPSKVRLYITSDQILNYYHPILFLFFWFKLRLPSKPGNRGGREILLLWGSVWIGFVQPAHHTLTLPTGTVQEAARCKAITRWLDRIQPMRWRVRGDIYILLIVKTSNLVFHVFFHFILLIGVCLTSWKTTKMTTSKSSTWIL